MAYAYNDPEDGVFGDAVSEVRYYLRDRTPAAPFSLTDAEITFELENTGQNRRLAAANAAYQMAVSYGAQAATQKSVGNLSISKQYGSQRGVYEALSRQLRAGVLGAAAAPVWSGEADADPTFSLGAHDYE